VGQLDNRSDASDQLLGGDEFIEKIKEEKIQLLNRKRETVEGVLQRRPDDETDKDALEAYNMIRFFRVKGADLDSETREIQDGQDELMYLIDMNS
jgi:hypothetical protein